MCATYGEDVGGAEDADDDAGGNDETPEGRPEGTLGGGCFVQVAEDGDADDDHDYAEGDEPVARGEERPVLGGVALEEGDFGEDEEYCAAFSSADASFTMERAEYEEGRGGGLTAHTACD